MEFTIIDGINLTFSAILMVAFTLTLIMFCIQYVSKLVEKYEQVQAVLRQTEGANESTPSQPYPSESSNTLSKKTLFEEDKLARVAVLTALAHASEDEPDKRFEVVSVIKK